MNFLWFEDFLVLAETGNFSRAAEERHVTQPAFSRRIRALEDWLGTTLLDRTSQPARLTEVGEWFRGEAEELMERVSRIPGEARSVAEAHSTTLRLAATHALSFTFLPRWLRTLETRTTLGPVQLMSDVLRQCEALMHQSKVQFVLSHTHPMTQGALEADGLLSAIVGSDVLVPVSAADQRGDPMYSLDVPGAHPIPVLQYSTDSGIGRITRAVVGGRLASMKTHAVFTAHLASVLRTMALDGRGIAWLPRTLIEEDLATRRLVAATVDSNWSVPAQIRLFRSPGAIGKAAEDFWNAAVSVAGE
ncbi:Quorum-sensing regulator protein D [Variovorax sp. PBL-H6]|uniref:LysR family transcriptional regulator n=1 Tax=Variovorax sp. PBL-H6 TaxID=434009 RepID=UPI0013160191|nr:LysR family transcriptional regulator [Variovorax sp. PBL-H6]VTU21864.1 Quorum-sensing regulator protein D [Variovorax sp. PBL-H6]